MMYISFVIEVKSKYNAFKFLWRLGNQQINPKLRPLFQASSRTKKDTTNLLVEDGPPKES